MSIDKRLRSIEKLGHLRGRKEQPATIERTSDGQFYILDGDARTLIGNEDDFRRWQADGNKAWAVIEGLTPEGSEMVRRIIGGARTEHKERK